MFWFGVRSEADRFALAGGAADGERRLRELEAARKAQEIIRKRDEVCDSY